MNDILLAHILLGIILIAIITLVIAIKLSAKPNNLNSIKVCNKTRHNFYINSYHFISKNPFAKKYLNRIRNRVEMLDFSDQLTTIRKTMQIAYGALAFSSGLILLLLLLNQEIYYIIIGLLSIYVIHNQLLIFFVDHLDDKLLVQLEKLLGDVRHHYHVHGMIDEAIYDSIDECGQEISGHVLKMYEVLTSEEAEEQLAKYYDLVPNKYFKTFLALSYTVQKFGDKSVDGKSMFLTNLNYIKQEINLEILKRRKLNYLFKSLTMISVTPIFFLTAIEKWAEANMQELKSYYEGSYGFMVQVGLFILVLICFELINKMQSRQVYGGITDRLEVKLLKIKLLHNIIQTIIGNQFNKAMAIEALIKKTGQKITVESIYLKRYIFAIGGFLLSLLVIIYGYQIEKNNILYTSEAIITDDKAINQEEERDIVAFDRSYILKLQRERPSYYSVEQALLKDSGINKRMVPLYAKRILDKCIAYERLYLKWWELLICIGIGGGFYYIPYWLLLFKKQIMYLSLEDEVMQFHSVILMLMHIERISVEDLLEWMGVFAEIFKESIEKCLNNFEQGDNKALEQLKIDEPFLPFLRLVENLQAATDKIAIEQAFDELKIERSYYQDKRKQDNEMILSKKGTWGKIIAFIPLTITILFYIITPFIHLSITQFVNYSNQINSYL